MAAGTFAADKTEAPPKMTDAQKVRIYKARAAVYEILVTQRDLAKLEEKARKEYEDAVAAAKLEGFQINADLDYVKEAKK